MKDIKSWLHRVLVFGGIVSFFVHAGRGVHAIAVVSALAFVVCFWAESKLKKPCIRLLLPFSSGLLCFLMRLFYWDRFDFFDRVSALLWLSLLFSLFLAIREFELLKRFLSLFNRLSLKRRLLAIFLVAEIVFIISSYTIVKKGVQLGGDEPHYLALAQSLVKDFDLNVFNQYFREGYREFIEVEKLRAHGAFGKGYKKLYSIHLPGVAITIAPFLLLKIPLPLLYFLIRAFLGLFGALLAVVGYLFSLKLWQRENLSLFVTAVFVLTAPVFFLSFHIFPELQALLLIVSALYFLLYPGKRVMLKTLLAGLLMGAAVFWGLKYVIFIYLFSLGFFVFFVVKREYKRALIFILFPLLFQLLFFYYLYFAYGNFSPMSIYTGMMSESQAREYYEKAGAIPFKTRVETTLGYFLDQRDGLLLYSPFYFFALPGFLVALRKFKTYWPHLLISLPAFVYILYHGYSTVRAGYCPQARYLVPVMWMLLLFCLVYYLESRGSGFSQKLFFLLPLYSLFAVVYQVIHPFTLYQPTTHDSVQRQALMFLQWGNLYVNPANVLPSFAKVAGNFSYLPNLVFLALVIVLALWALRYTKARPVGREAKRCLSTKHIPPILFVAVFCLFILPPRVGLYNPTLVQREGDLPFRIFRESRRPRRVSEKTITINRAGRKAFTVSTLKAAGRFVLEIENRGKGELRIAAYNFDAKAGETTLKPGRSGQVIIDNPAFKTLKNRCFYQFTLLLEPQDSRPPLLDLRLFPQKRP